MQNKLLTLTMTNVQVVSGVGNLRFEASKWQRDLATQLPLISKIGEWLDAFVNFVKLFILLKQSLILTTI